MQIHGPSNVHGHHGLKGPHSSPRGNSPTPSTPAVGPADQVEISAAADAAAAASEKGEIRPDLVARVRSEIAAGTYESPDKLDLALEKLLDDIV